MTAANLVEPGEYVLVITTGVFGDWFAECFEVYGAKVSQITGAFGDRPSLDQIESALKSKNFKLISITHVDTSSGVLNDVKEIAALVKRVSPSTLIAVDGVCSVGGELIKQEEWGLDVVMTASQKAIGVPPGLALMVVSQRALEITATRQSAPTTYFGSFLKWLPIMKRYEARQPSYFATPPVQLIMALNVSLKQIVNESLLPRFERHQQVSSRVKDTLERWGLKLVRDDIQGSLYQVPVNRTVAANTLTAVYYPEGVSGPDFLKAVTSSDVVIAGGLHPLHNSKYFRVGHVIPFQTKLISPRCTFRRRIQRKIISTRLSRLWEKDFRQWDINFQLNGLITIFFLCPLHIHARHEFPEICLKLFT